MTSKALDQVTLYRADGEEWIGPVNRIHQALQARFRPRSGEGKSVTVPDIEVSTKKKREEVDN